MKHMKSLLMQIIAALVAVYHGFQSHVLAANTYDAAVETHAETVTRTNDAAITTRHLLWKVGAGAGTVAVCTAADIPIGTIDNTETATGVAQTVLLLGHGGTRKMVASKIIAYGAVVYSAAAGKVSDSGTYPVGVALTAAGQDGDVIEVQCYSCPVGAGMLAASYDKHTIVASQAVDHVVDGVTVAEQRLVGRITGGNIDDLTAAQARTILYPVSYTAATSAADSLAIPITSRSCLKTTGADAEALSLADGAYLGQKLHICLVVDGGGDGTLTPTTKSGFTTIVFADKGDNVDLEWTTSGWIITGSAGVAAPPVITLA